MNRRLCWLWISLSSMGTACAADVPPPRPDGFALVELFTSEGCSSCPPADALLARLVRDAANSGRSVIGLSFHVDYWNSLGWRDPYSDPAFTDRQRDYERALEVRGPYTPQMVVNGTDQFVGSNEAQAERSIRKFLARAPGARIDLEASNVGADVEVRWRVSTAPPGSVLRLAWVRSEAASNPSRGENAGRKLRHVQVVRAFRSVALRGALAGRTTLTRPEPDRGSVVAFVQNERTGEVLGAATVAP